MKEAGPQLTYAQFIAYAAALGGKFEFVDGHVAAMSRSSKASGSHDVVYISGAVRLAAGDYTLDTDPPYTAAGSPIV